MDPDDSWADPGDDDLAAELEAMWHKPSPADVLVADETVTVRALAGPAQSRAPYPAVAADDALQATSSTWREAGRSWALASERLRAGSRWPRRNPHAAEIGRLRRHRPSGRPRVVDHVSSTTWPPARPACWWSPLILSPADWPAWSGEPASMLTPAQFSWWVRTLPAPLAPLHVADLAIALAAACPSSVVRRYATTPQEPDDRAGGIIGGMPSDPVTSDEVRTPEVIRRFATRAELNAFLADAPPSRADDTSVVFPGTNGRRATRDELLAYIEEHCRRQNDHG